MADGFGVNFAPGEDPRQRTQPGGAGSGAPPLQSAIRFLSLRLPKFTGPGGIAPPALLNGQGGSGLDPGMLQQLLQQFGGGQPPAMGYNPPAPPVMMPPPGGGTFTPGGGSKPEPKIGFPGQTPSPYPPMGPTPPPAPKIGVGSEPDAPPPPPIGSGPGMPPGVFPLPGGAPLTGGGMDAGSLMDMLFKKPLQQGPY